MSVSNEDVLHIARLSKLEISDDQVDVMRERLGEILSYVARLDELDTSDVEPTTHPVEARMNLRPDTADPRLSREQVVQNAPAVEDGMFQVPKIVDGGS